MRFLFLTIFIAGLVLVLVAIFIVPAEDRIAVTANIRNPIPESWMPAELFKRIIAVPEFEPVPQASLSPSSIERIGARSGDPVGDWIYNCLTSATANQNCTLSQQITNSKGIIAFSWVISIDAAGQFAAQWQTATGVMVNRGILLDAGTERPIRLPYSSCVSGYCQADANLADDFVETLLKTTGATATVQPITGQAVTFTISTQGLADGLRALRAAALKS